HADVGVADRAVQLDARIDGDFLSPEQTDLTAEKREHVGTGRGNAAWNVGPRAREAENPSALEKECALLGEEQGEARQIDLARVHFGFAEVGIERRRQLEIGRDVVEQVEPWLASHVVQSGPTDMQPPTREERTQVEADPLAQLAQVGELTCLGHLEKLRLQKSARPPVILELSVDRARD